MPAWPFVSYYGSEPLYSGLSGTIMHADIFIGVVYYQRLRHMVSDKSQVRSFPPRLGTQQVLHTSRLGALSPSLASCCESQVRATGPINSLTRQPIKGRKNHGGIRLGEMERDALLAHGSETQSPPSSFGTAALALSWCGNLGTSFLLMDRLMNCSDKHIAYVCRSPSYPKHPTLGA